MDEHHEAGCLHRDRPRPGARVPNVATAIGTCSTAPAEARHKLRFAGRRSGNSFDFNRGSSAADLLLLSGRPVLIAPPELERSVSDGETLVASFAGTIRSSTDFSAWPLAFVWL